MRTSIVLDQDLVAEAFKYASFTSTKELVDLALREFIQRHRRQDVCDLRGRALIDPSYDYRIARGTK